MVEDNNSTENNGNERVDDDELFEFLADFLLDIMQSYRQEVFRRSTLKEGHNASTWPEKEIELYAEVGFEWDWGWQEEMR